MAKMIVKLAVKAALILMVNAKLEVQPERAVLLYYNETIVKDVKFTYTKINRTSFAMNLQYTLLYDIPDNDAIAHVKFDKKAGNEYKTIGMTMKFNLCDFYRTNAYGIAEDIGKCGNYTICDMKKGFYYVKNYNPDLSKLPQLIPGKFKTYVRVTHHRAEMFELHWYVAIVDTLTW